MSKRSKRGPLVEALSGDSYVREEPTDPSGVTTIKRHYDRVTSIIRFGLPFWSGVDEDAMIAAADRGLRVHKACHENALLQVSSEKKGHIGGQVDYLVNLEDDIRGHLNAWLLFTRDTNFKPALLEQPLASDVHGVAGRPDAIGKVDGVMTVVDYTVGSATLAKQLQTSVYAHLWRLHSSRKEHGYSRGFDGKLQRIEVHLKPTGKYSFRLHECEDDFNGFLSLLGWYRYNIRRQTI